MQDLAESTAMRKEIEAILGSRARVVRGILFDKTEGAGMKQRKATIQAKYQGKCGERSTVNAAASPPAEAT